MARRAGGSYGSSNNLCTENGAFRRWYEQGLIAIDGIMLFLLLLIFFAWLVMRARSKPSRSILSWLTYGIAIIFGILAYVVDIIITVLEECDVFDRLSTYYKALIIEPWLGNISRVLLLGVILIALALRLRDPTGNGSKMLKLLAMAPIALLVILLIVNLGMLTYIYNGLANSSAWSSGYSESYLTVHYERISATYHLLYLLISILAGLILILGTSKAHGAAKVFVPLLAFSLFAFAFLEVFYAFYYGVTNHYTTVTASVVTSALESFFTLLTFLFPVMIAGNSVFEHTPMYGKDDHQYDSTAQNVMAPYPRHGV